MAHYSKVKFSMVSCVPDTALGTENTEMLIIKSLSWQREHSNDPALHMLADRCDCRFGGTPKDQVLGFRK